MLIGALGAPVFAEFSGGLARVLGPTGGYLLSYPLIAALVGLLGERGWDRRPATAVLAMVAGSLLILLLGTLWLAPFVGGLRPALWQGALPFLPGDLLKAALAAALLPACWALLRHGERTPRGPAG